MNILVIASLLPVPGIIKETVYVLKLKKYYQKKYPDSRFLFIRPVASGRFIPNRFKSLNQRSRDAAIRQGDFNSEGDEFLVWPYYSIGRNSFFHSVLSGSIMLQLKKRQKRIEDFSPDIIHAHFLFPDGILAKRLAEVFNIPYVLTMQDESRFLSSSSAFKQSERILQHASVLTTLSPIMAAMLEVKGYKNVHLLLPGIDESFFNQKKPARKDRTVRFVTAANLIKRKNINSVIEALAFIDETHDITYTIIGDGPEKAELVQLTENLNQKLRIRFLPAVPNEELASVLVKYDVYIQPSFVDTYGLSYFEALACGLPVILTKNTGAYYIIKDFKSYLTADPYDIKDIAEKILTYSDINIVDSQFSACKEASLSANWNTTILNLHTIYRDNIKGCK